MLKVRFPGTFHYNILSSIMYHFAKLELLYLKFSEPGTCLGRNILGKAYAKAISLLSRIREKCIFLMLQ